MNPKVSVITVCRNAEEFIEQAINSVSEQTYKNIEYIVIDGNSTDSTTSIINRYLNRIDSFVSEQDNGVYDAMNKGIKNAAGDIIYFLNSDDRFYDKHVIENVVHFFQYNENIEFVYGSVAIVNPITNETFVKTHENVKKSFFYHNVICQQGIFYRAESFKKVGLFDSTLKIVGDYEWELRALYKFNIKNKYYPQIFVIYRDGGISSKGKFFELHQEERKKVQREYFTKYELYYYKSLNTFEYLRRRMDVISK